MFYKVTHHRTLCASCVQQVFAEDKKRAQEREDATRDSAPSVAAASIPTSASAADEAHAAAQAAEQAMAHAAKIKAEAQEAKLAAAQAREAEQAVAAKVATLDGDETRDSAPSVY